MRTYWFDSATFIAQIMDRMVAAFARGDMGYLTRAFDLFLYSIPSPGEATAHPLVNRFFELLFDRNQVLDSVSGYAQRLGISPSYLNKLVRTQTRHSAMDWVEISRVNWAKSLLKDSDMSVGEVSVAIGVDDPSYFTRFFRKSTGMTPSEFRHRMVRNRT
jgi:AraC-like DNA-binding protein